MDITDILYAKKLSGGGGGGGELPEVTSADEGKVLAVNASGEWEAEQKIVFINRDASDTLDKTWNEINTLMRNGVICVVRSIDESIITMKLIIFCDSTTLICVVGDELFVASSADDYPVLD